MEATKQYLQKEAFYGGKKLFSCDVLTGELKEVKPEKEYLRHKETGVITAHQYVMTTKNVFHLSAKNIKEAHKFFTERFKALAEKL